MTTSSFKLLLIRWWRGKYHRRKFREMLKFKRSVGEQLAAGKDLFNKSYSAVVADMLWASINSKGKPVPYTRFFFDVDFFLYKGYAGDSKAELQRFFMILAPQGLLDMGALTRLMKELGIVGKGPGLVDPQKSDMLFAKIKGPTEKKLDFKKFVDYLYVITTLHVLRIEVSVSRSDDGDMDGKQSKKGAAMLSDEQQKQLDGFRYYKLTSRPAIVVLIYLLY